MAEINTRIHKVLDLGANPSPMASPAPLQEGVASTRVNMFGPILVAYVILSFHHAHGPSYGLRGARSEPWDANLTEDTGCQMSGSEGEGEDTPTKSRSSSEEEEEGEISLPPFSSLHITPPPFSDIVSRQLGATVDERQLKRTQTGTRLSTNLPW
jgi:hypothetical protein